MKHVTVLTSILLLSTTYGCGSNKSSSSDGQLLSAQSCPAKPQALQSAIQSAKQTQVGRTILQYVEKNGWCIRITPTGSSGTADPVNKILNISNPQDTVVIHEGAHAVTLGGLGANWYSQYGLQNEFASMAVQGIDKLQREGGAVTAQSITQRIGLPQAMSGWIANGVRHNANDHALQRLASHGVISSALSQQLLQLYNSQVLALPGAR